MSDEDLLKQRATARSLGIEGNNLSLLFSHAANRYRSPERRRALSGIALEVFKVLFNEEHTTMQEIGTLHGRETLGSKSVGSITRAISTLRERGIPIQTEQVSDPNSSSGTLYTRYFFEAVYKTGLLEEVKDVSKLRDESTLGEGPS